MNMHIPGRSDLCRWCLALLVLGQVSSAMADTGVAYPANPSVHGQTLVVSANGLFAFERAGLQPLWSVLERENTLAPVSDGDTLFVASSRGLVAVAFESGAIRWSQRTGGLAFAPTLVGDRLILGNRQGLLRALDKGTGREIWLRSFPGWIHAPAVAGGRLVTGGRNGSLWALDPVDGEIVWRRSLAQELIHPPVSVSAQAVAFATFDGAVSALDGGGGASRWRSLDTSPVLAATSRDDRLYLTRLDGRAQAVDAETGRYLWSQDLDGRATAPPLFADERVLVALAGGRVAVLSSRNGEILQTFAAPGRIFGSPLSIDGRLIVFVSDLEHPFGVRPVVLESDRTATANPEVSRVE